jgi:hypothetical protein
MTARDQYDLVISHLEQAKAAMNEASTFADLASMPGVRQALSNRLLELINANFAITTLLVHDYCESVGGFR